MMAHELLHRIATLTQARRCILVTSETTGNPALEKASSAQFETMVSMQYSPATTAEPGTDRYRTIDQVADEARRLGPFDVAFVDPYHTYEASMVALACLAECIRDRGWMIVHDCFPPFELASDIYQDGPWCGSTYAAFRDVAETSDRAWFVADSDFGLGVLGPASTAHLIRHAVAPELAALWRESDIDSKRELLKDAGVPLMRVVSPARVDDLLSSFLRNEAVTL